MNLFGAEPVAYISSPSADKAALETISRDLDVLYDPLSAQVTVTLPSIIHYSIPSDYTNCGVPFSETITDDELNWL